MRRGLTFLETILAATILALFTVTVVGALNYCVASHARGEHRLAAAELANRLMIIYLDDDKTLREMPRQVDYGPNLYRWDLEEKSVYATPAKDPGDRRQSGSLDRFVNVAITVWLSEQSGGGAAPVTGVPSVRIVRIVDPVPLRNADSLNFQVSDDERRREFIKKLTGGRPARPTGAPVQPGSSNDGGAKK